MIRRIKWENIFLILSSPLPIIEFIKANKDFKILSILLSLSLISGLYISIRTIRKEVK